MRSAWSVVALAGTWLLGCGGDGAAPTGNGGAGGTPQAGAAGEAGAGGSMTPQGSAGAPGGGSAGAFARDASAEPTDAAATVNTTCNPAPGKALRFDGTLVDLMTGDLGADLPGGDVPRTIELWAKFLGPQSWKAEGSVLETGIAKGGSNKVLGLDLSGYAGSTAEFGPYTNGYSDNNHPNGVFVPNTPATGWIHLSWSYSGNHGVFSFTVDGKEQPVKTQTGAPTMAFAPGIVTLGASQTFGTAGWSGVIDEVRLWSVARTPAEVARDMRVVLRGDEPGLVAYYRLDEGAGSTAEDVAKKPSHRLQVCTDVGPRCAAKNAADPTWVDSDIPGPFTCAR